MEPVSFNAIKHHLAYCLEQMHKVKNEEDLGAFIRHTLRMGHSTLDLYLGQLTVESISKQIIQTLEADNRLKRSDFARWVKKSQGYRNIKLDDGSQWTLRLAAGHRYIHIHPSRYSKHGMRTHGNTFRTATAVVCMSRISGREPDADLINDIRQRAGLPKVKSLKTGHGLARMIKLVEDYY